MSEILFLSHRIPYPPDKGDKIRSYHVLRALAARHKVHVGTFVDDASDWQHVADVQRLCGGETCIRALRAGTARLRSSAGLLTGGPLTMAYYRDKALGHWVAQLAARRSIRGVFAFSSSMGPYAECIGPAAGTVRIMDFCDVDSDKWAQYAASHAFPLKAIYSRESRKLAAAEARYVRSFDASLVISDAEAGILRKVAGAAGGRIRVVPNGVDTEYFDPMRPYANPFEPGTSPIVFTGAMDYHANVDGVQWFAREVFPEIRRQLPRAVFAIVGSNPVPGVRELAASSGVTVTGRVPDVRPYLAHAAVVVAPLRIARGVQNKVLEALAMARPIVATENALQGIPGAADGGVAIASDPVGMARAVLRCAAGGSAEPRGREFVQARYGWTTHLSAVVSLFDSQDSSVRAPAASAAAVA